MIGVSCEFHSFLKFEDGHTIVLILSCRTASLVPDLPSIHSDQDIARTNHSLLSPLSCVFQELTSHLESINWFCAYNLLPIRRKLGLAGVVRGIEVDTAFFTGNQVPRISIQV